MKSYLNELKKQNNKLCDEHDEFVKTNDGLVKQLSKTKDKESKIKENITAN